MIHENSAHLDRSDAEGRFILLDKPRSAEYLKDQMEDLVYKLLELPCVFKDPM